MPSYSSHHSKRGFTLTELFVCVLIVFVVGFVLFPVFIKPRAVSNHGSSATNQRQIAIGFLQYIQDYDDRFPPAIGYVRVPTTKETKSSSSEKVFAQSWGPDRVSSDGRRIPGIVSPYVGSSKLFLDPANRYELDQDKRILEYMYNDLLVGQSKESIKDAKVTVLTTEAENRFENAGHALTLDLPPFSAVFNSKGGCDAGMGASVGKERLLHNGGANFAFTDGHVKWFQGGADDPVFFPFRDSASVSAIDPQTKQQIGPVPGGDMRFQGQHYVATFHLR